jgi:hypothetical protein
MTSGPVDPKKGSGSLQKRRYQPGSSDVKYFMRFLVAVYIKDSQCLVKWVLSDRIENVSAGKGQLMWRCFL